MSTARRPAPRFGEADLSNCELEQIQFTGSIQPHGALLVVREADRVVMQASTNHESLLGLPRSPVGATLESLGGNLAGLVDEHLHDSLHRIPVAFRCTLGDDGKAFDTLIHRPPGGGLVVELEPDGAAVDVTGMLGDAVKAISAAPSLRALGDETACRVKEMTGYDRVMVYRFDSEGHGEVFCEAKEPELEAFLGNHYPASDIPQIARRLYERNRVRVLVDVEYEPVLIEPGGGRDSELDLSLSFLRSMSPIHLQYLKNMGVRATLVASLMVGGRLWGLIACHHYAPRSIPYALRAVCELIAETVSTRIAALQSVTQSHAELAVRRIEQRMIDAISRDGDWRSALFDGSDSVLRPLDASGAALLFEGQVHTAGDVPSTQDLRAIGEWLQEQERDQDGLLGTSSLATSAPDLAHLTGIASGLLATPVSDTPGEYLLWLRPEKVHTVTWGGNPFKPVVIGSNPADLSPRRSFSQWHQQVRGTAIEWSDGDRAAARLIGESVSDVILQFRSLRMLVLEDQLETASGQVREAQHPAVIADSQGRILLTNDRFERLLRPGDLRVQWLEDLPDLFSQPERVRSNLEALLRSWQPWRAELEMMNSAGGRAPLLLRADPVLASQDRVLGFVLLFTDLAARKSVEMARRHFQQSVAEGLPAFKAHPHSGDEPAYREVLSEIVDNAQLAALEITDGVNLQQVPGMLEGVRTSVARCAELLEHLNWYAGPADDD